VSPTVTATVTGGQIAGSPTGRAIADMAMRYVGYPYAYGGADPSGFDCSGFVYWVLSQVGISAPRSSYDQVLIGRRVALEDLQPGDLVFFEDTFGPGVSHSAIYVGNGRMIHAISEGNGVELSYLYSGYWAGAYYGARRVTP
jgi:cell wall-associated NlpC family hydrolase